MSSTDLIDFDTEVQNNEEEVETQETQEIQETEETEEVVQVKEVSLIARAEEVVEEHKEESEGMKALKKGAGALGGFFKKGWGAVKSGASKANEKFKETEVRDGYLDPCLVRQENCC